MGYGSWSARSYADYATAASLSTKSVHQVFEKRTIQRSLDPKNVIIRESCDSVEHPESTPIVLGLDVTGSMGIYAHEIAVTHLPKLMNGILETVKDPHIMFMGIDDVHANSSAPLQVSQFETDIKIVEQLRDIFLVGGGGGNHSESYDLTWWFAANKTKTDSFDKRGKQGFLFTFGDEQAPYQTMTIRDFESVFGSGQYCDMLPTDMLKQAQEKYQVFHIVIEQGSHYRSFGNLVRRTWTEMLGNNVLFLKDSAYLSDLVLATIEIANGKDINRAINDSICPEILTHAFSNSLGDLCLN